jgi:hypothetical protein
MTSARRKFLHLAVGAATLPAVMRIANAQTYPKRSVTMAVTCRAGSGRAAPDGYQFGHGGADTFTQSQIALRESRLGATP